ncbi:putative phosphotransferase NDAI_0J01400 [Naumovozyma dairenensis CBS 421]|uniref:Carbohydrate kinase FGGY C-terminal domain-containing protein n=1 Tax=Naumovozyma dairenensis (strain ATCC 10597 / BCRC 20456 / CBS 421 / NBRC 0211 / NRRL Y-12639) TaxID=1071378 RepID=G0WGV4_NAUDC|nr:hypothetical protein NDAI_0J01400 [Naumovozyma dairenensis CBS 421]CCD27032.1 hypothetical protein NDAI_0J01400 [Naumovozyma dairenensis CBS 421]
MEKDIYYYIGVDVGTGSVRACIIDDLGTIKSQAELSIHRQELKTDCITQSSQEIWRAVCFCVKKVVNELGCTRDQVKGIGFDATCSLVVVDKVTNRGVAVGPDFNDSNQDIILWMDHRALKETKEINSTNDECLKYVGGQMSIEMELPKIKWLKRHMSKDVFARCEFYDLADYLTFKATGRKTRSFCSVVCKQGMVPMGVEGSKLGWSKDFLRNIDLEELTYNDYAKLGGSVSGSHGRNFLTAGEYIAPLNDQAIEELELSKECIVGSGIIDAYAGWLGTVGSGTVDLEQLFRVGMANAIGRLAAVAGTSTCHIVLSKDPIFVPGVWGPYKDTITKGYWCTEGGQSCTGALLQHVLQTHPSYKELEEISEKNGMNKFDYLNTRLAEMAKRSNERSVLCLAKHIFFYGDLHGNRSPLADPSMKGAIVGLSMDTSLDNLAKTYLAACEFIAQQNRQIIEAMCDAGHEISAIYMSGGQCRNSLLMKLLADCSGLSVIIPEYIDSAVVFGAAILGASASKLYQLNGSESDTVINTENILWSTMNKMTKVGSYIMPVPKDHPDRILLDAKYKIFLDMADRQKRYRAIVDAVED